MLAEDVFKVKYDFLTYILRDKKCSNAFTTTTTKAKRKKERKKRKENVLLTCKV